MRFRLQMILQVPAIETRMPKVVLEVSKRYTAKKPAVAVGVAIFIVTLNDFGRETNSRGFILPPGKKQDPKNYCLLQNRVFQKNARVFLFGMQ